MSQAALSTQLAGKGSASLSGKVPFVHADGEIGTISIDAGLSDFVLNAAGRMSRTMPDAVAPADLARLLIERRAILVLIEAKNGEHFGAVAIGSQANRDGQRFLAVNVEVAEEIGPSLAFFTYVEATALRDGLGLSILANGPLPVPAGYDFRDEGEGDRILTLKMTRH